MINFWRITLNFLQVVAFLFFALGNVSMEDAEYRGLLIRSALQFEAKSTPGSGGNFWVIKKDVCELVRIKN